VKAAQPKKKTKKKNRQHVWNAGRVARTGGSAHEGGFRPPARSSAWVRQTASPGRCLVASEWEAGGPDVSRARAPRTPRSFAEQLGLETWKTLSFALSSSRAVASARARSFLLQCGRDVSKQEGIRRPVEQGPAQRQLRAQTYAVDRCGKARRCCKGMLPLKCGRARTSDERESDQPADCCCCGCCRN
jgi:hypothetical protein